ncbi:hypothetical protein GCM10023148_18530 [Actinokineospora soli]
MLAALVSAVIGGVVVTAPAAQAAAPRAGNGVCESGEVCLYYNSNHRGSMRDFNASVKTYGTGTSCLKFVSAGTGRGKCVKNNAASVWNRTAAPVAVFRKSNHAGAIDTFDPGQKVNLASYLKNENAGHLIGKRGYKTLEQGVYASTAGRITSYFDGYLSQSGRHEGIDFARGSGVPVHSLIAGTVVNVKEGSDSPSRLSTIAIYNRALNKTVVYLHTDPQVRVGQSIAKGQRIAKEANRAGGSAHTHVELRNGRQLWAAPSVNDPRLTNPNPTAFWVSQGYNICCQ